MNKIYLDQASTSFPKAPSVAQAVYAPWQLQVHDRRVSEVLSEEHSDWQ